MCRVEAGTGPTRSPRRPNGAKVLEDAGLARERANPPSKQGTDAGKSGVWGGAEHMQQLCRVPLREESWGNIPRARQHRSEPSEEGFFQGSNSHG